MTGVCIPGPSYKLAVPCTPITLAQNWKWRQHCGDCLFPAYLRECRTQVQAKTLPQRNRQQVIEVKNAPIWPPSTGCMHQHTKYTYIQVDINDDWLMMMMTMMIIVLFQTQGQRTEVHTYFTYQSDLASRFFQYPSVPTWHALPPTMNFPAKCLGFPSL